MEEAHKEEEEEEEDVEVVSEPPVIVETNPSTNASEFDNAVNNAENEIFGNSDNDYSCLEGAARHYVYYFFVCDVALTQISGWSLLISLSLLTSFSLASFLPYVHGFNFSLFVSLLAQLSVF